MKIEKCVGKTLGELAEQTRIFSRAVRIFVLQDENDDTGKRLMEVYSLQQVISACPAAKDAIVVSAYELCRETVLRIRMVDVQADPARK